MSKKYEKLTLSEIIIGKDKCLQNAGQLLNESELLYKNGMYARAYFLISIAVEELGKHIILVSCAINFIVGKVDWRKFWLKFCSHKKKTGTILHFENIFLTSNDEFINPEELNEIVSKLDEYKMTSLYTDFIDGTFSNPEDLISPDLVKSALNLAKKRLDFFTDYNMKYLTYDNFIRLDEKSIEDYYKDLGIFTNSL